MSHRQPPWHPLPRAPLLLKSIKLQTSIWPQRRTRGSPLTLLRFLPPAMAPSTVLRSHRPRSSSPPLTVLSSVSLSRSSLPVGSRHHLRLLEHRRRWHPGLRPPRLTTPPRLIWILRIYRAPVVHLPLQLRSTVRPQSLSANSHRPLSRPLRRLLPLPSFLLRSRFIAHPKLTCVVWRTRSWCA